LSFIDKNKVWLLPLLGLGILGVGYMNYRSFSGGGSESAPTSAAPEQPTPEPPTQPATTTPSQPAAPTPSQAPPASVDATDASSSGNLWDDLQGFAVVPGTLAQEQAVKDRARVAMGPELEDPPPLRLERPNVAASTKPLRKDPSLEKSLTLNEAPELEFLVHGAQGNFAWFDGSAYKVGDSLPGTNFVVNRIESTFVELRGPQGLIRKYANPVNAPDTKPSDPSEAP
jgi:prepilin-type processing-associated H-X9-DG protein